MFLRGSPEDRFYNRDGVVVGVPHAEKVWSLKMSVDRGMDHQGTLSLEIGLASYPSRS